MSNVYVNMNLCRIELTGVGIFSSVCACDIYRLNNLKRIIKITYYLWFSKISKTQIEKFIIVGPAVYRHNQINKLYISLYRKRNDTRIYYHFPGSKKKK